MIERLELAGHALHHKRNIKNVLSLRATVKPFLLCGVGVYSGIDEDVLDPDAVITFDKTTTSVSVWRDGKLVAEQTITMDTNQARKYINVRKSKLPKHTVEVHFPRPVILELNQVFEVAHSLSPTDVKNHFSGWPVTICGADLWTCYGQLKANHHRGLVFAKASEIQGRSCLNEGQLPYFFVWELT